MTFDKLLEEYFKHRILRPASIANYQEARRNLQRFFHSIGRNLPDLEDLTTDDLLQHRAWSLASTASTSYNKHRRHLRALITFAVNEGHLPSSPLVKVIPAPQASRRPKVVATSWYRRACALLDNPQAQGLNPTDFWHTALSVMHFTALRRRQLVALRWRDVIWSRSALVLSSDGSKSRKEWTVPIPRWLMADIRALQDRTQARLGQAPSGDDQVFCLPVFSP